MINFDTRKIDEAIEIVIKYNKDSKIKLSNDLFLDFSINKNDYLIIALQYKEFNIKTVHYFYDNDNLTENNEPLLNQINDLFQSFVKQTPIFIEDANYANISQYLSFIIQREILARGNEIFIQTLDDITIISVQYDDKNREIWMMYLNEDEVIQFTGEILYTFENSKYEIYNPYDFMFRNMLFLGNPKYNKLSTELIYILQ